MESRVRAKTLPPQTIGDHDRLRPLLALVVRCQSSADGRLHLQRIEDRSGGADHVDACSVAAPGEVHGPHDVLRQRFERGGVRSPVLEVLLVDLHRRDPPVGAAPDLTYRHEAMRFVVGQRLQQHAVHDRENGRRGAGRERERQDDGDRVRGIAAQRLERVAQVERQGAHTALDGWSSSSVVRGQTPYKT
jgi:hypothetical protein